MSNGVEKAASLIIAMAVMALLGIFVFRSLQSTKGAVNNGVYAASDMANALSEEELNRYDGREMTGVQAVEAVREHYNDDIRINIIDSDGDDNYFGYEDEALTIRTDGGSITAAVQRARETTKKDLLYKVEVDRSGPFPELVFDIIQE